MELPLEACMFVARHIDTKRELASLCRVSKGFKNAAERVLYNSIEIRGYTSTRELCRVLAGSPRPAALVVALTIHVTSDASDSETSVVAPPDDYWNLIAAALQRTHRLQSLNFYIENTAEMGYTYVLDNCAFQLRAFHCDFSWDRHLVDFLNTQVSLTDLYILDFRNDINDPTIALNSQSLPRLSVLECTFIEAATTLASNRCLSRLKTCFSSSDVGAKRAELRNLVASLRRSRRHLRALDIADSTYSPRFSLETLATITESLPSSSLRYLGTLTLPIDGRQRIELYGLLMRHSRLQCVELEVSDWDPAPMTPAALRALMYELRLYCPSITAIIFVYDLDRVVMRLVDYRCVLEQDAGAELLWREV